MAERLAARPEGTTPRPPRSRRPQSRARILSVVGNEMIFASAWVRGSARRLARFSRVQARRACSRDQALNRFCRSGIRPEFRRFPRATRSPPRAWDRRCASARTRAACSGVNPFPCTTSHDAAGASMASSVSRPVSRNVHDDAPPPADSISTDPAPEIFGATPHAVDICVFTVPAKCRVVRRFPCRRVHRDSEA